MIESTQNQLLNHADSNAGTQVAGIQKMMIAPIPNTTTSQIA